MIQDPRHTRRASTPGLSSHLNGLVTFLDLAFATTALLAAVLAFAQAVQDRSAAELACALGLFVSGGLLLSLLLDSHGGPGSQPPES